MTTGRLKRLIGSLAAGALALSGVSLATALPANAVTPGVTLVTQADISQNETVYKGWHEGYANKTPAYFVGWDGVHLGGGTHSQIINGLVDTGQPGLTVGGTQLLTLITGSTISVTSGSVTAQVAVTTDGAGGWATLRPAAPSTSTSKPATATDLWLSSQPIGNVAKETPMSLTDLLTKLNGQGNLRYSAFGFQAEPSNPLAVVKAMTWGDQTFNFGPSVQAISDTSTVKVVGSDIRLDEATYPGWHEGYVNKSPAFSVKPDGLHLGDGANSQIIDGLTTPTVNPDLRSLITSSSVNVVSGDVSFQVPLYYGSIDKPDFTTIRPASNAMTGTAKFLLTDSWVSSYPISATTLTPAIAAGTPVVLGDLIDALEAHSSVQLLAFGVLAMGTDPSVVASINWDGVQYSFLVSGTQTTLSGGSTSFFGSDVTYTAKVSALTPADGVPTGDVEFWSNALLLGTVALDKGSATWTVKDLPIGPTTITAKFLGSDSWTKSSTENTQTVATAPTTIAVPTPDGTLVGSNVVLTATVTSGAGVPTGNVEFAVNGSAATSVVLVDGKASFTVTNLPQGITRVVSTYLGSSTYGGSSVVTDIAVAFPKATGTANEIYITRVYRDLFGRSPEPAGLAFWTAKLESGTSRGAVADGITYSIEYRSRLITGAYSEYLGRTPDAGGLQTWLGEMNKGMTVSQIDAGFLESPEFYTKSGGTDWGWVGQMYSKVLHRSASTAEVSFWVQRLSTGSSRHEVSMGFLLSSEHLTTVVNGHYVSLLHRNLDTAGQATWVGILQNGGRDEAIIAGIVASAEYFSMV